MKQAVKIKKTDPKSLYVSRKVINAAEIHSWAEDQGFENIVPEEKMHVTIVASKAPIDWMKLGNADEWNSEEEFKVPEGGPRIVCALGDNKAPVLMFGSSKLSWRNEEALRLGASWDFNEYQPHITVSYEPTKIDLDDIEPFTGEIILGPEMFEEFDQDWVDTNIRKLEVVKPEEYSNSFNIIKLDDEARMVYGWASVIKENGIDVIDTQGDIIKSEELIQASTEFMKSARMSLAMHKGGSIGQVIHSFPLVGDLMKSLGVESEKEGWIVGVSINDAGVWNQVKSGELKAFSIGATAVREPV